MPAAVAQPDGCLRLMRRKRCQPGPAVLSHPPCTPSTQQCPTRHSTRWATPYERHKGLPAPNLSSRHKCQQVSQTSPPVPISLTQGDTPWPQGLGSDPRVAMARGAQWALSKYLLRERAAPGWMGRSKCQCPSVSSATTLLGSADSRAVCLCVGVGGGMTPQVDMVSKPST